MTAPYGVDPSGNPLDRYGLSRPVWLLGWVSFFTDTASEMVYPLLPLFLTRVLGAGAMSLGVIEGVAEAANSALKIVSGWLAVRSGTPKRLVLVSANVAVEWISCDEEPTSASNFPASATHSWAARRGTSPTRTSRS